MKILGFHKQTGSILAVLVATAMLTGSSASAQLRDYLNLPDHDSKRYYLGIGFLYDNSHLQVTPHPKFLQSDSVLSIMPGNSGGFGVSGMFTLRLSEHWENGLRYRHAESNAPSHGRFRCGVHAP